MLDIMGVVKKCHQLDRDFRATTAADADLWGEMAAYLTEWGDKKMISWVKAHTEEGGLVTGDYEKNKQKKRMKTPVQSTYSYLDPPLYMTGYCSQLDTLWGAAVDEKVVIHKMEATVLRYLQTTQYLRYWMTRTRTEAWADNTDVEGHADFSDGLRR